MNHIHSLSVVLISVVFISCSFFGGGESTPLENGSGVPGSAARSYPDARTESGALKTSVSFRLVNALQEGANDLIVRSIFENESTEASFGQDIIENSLLRREFADVRPYNDPQSYYMIEMVNYRIIKPRTMNTSLYAKVFVFQFVLRFRDFKQTTGDNDPTGNAGYVVTQGPVSIKNIGNLSPIGIYTMALNRFITTSVQYNYYKPAEQIERENSEVPPNQ